MKRVFKLIVLLSFCCLAMSARPARKTVTTYTQPDGSRIEVRLLGDEWCNLRTTADGCAVVKDADGWYCYAKFDSLGKRHSSGVHVGAQASEAVKAASRAIPYEAMRERAALRRSQISRGIRPSMSSGAATKGGSPAEMRGIIILAQFTDVKFEATREMFADLASKAGYSYNGATGCAEEYFRDQVGELYDISFDVSEIVTLSHPLAYYGANDDDGNDIRPAEAVAEACRLAHESAVNPVDFSKYDSDADGYVDNIFLFVAGADAADGADDDCLWSHSWSLRSANITLRLDGKTIDDYALSTELADVTYGKTYEGTFTGIGAFCHEFSHILGLPDFYDTDYDESGGQSDALWKTLSLMDSGNFNNSCNTPPCYTALELDYLGIGTCETVTSGSYTLQPISREKRYIRIDTDCRDEYYLLECRDNNGWDAYIGAKGLAVYHIDKSTRSAGMSTYYKKNLTAYQRWMVYNEVNCRPDHQCADLIEANPKAKSVKSVLFPYGTTNSLGPDTTPALKYWSGATPEFGINGITLNADGSVSFTVGTSLKITSATPWQTAVKLNWESDAASCSVSVGGEAVLKEVKPYEDERFACILEGLEPSTQYTVVVSGGGASGSVSFKTKSYYEGSHPFIYFADAQRGDDGSFVSGSKIPLHVYNTPGAAETKWYFNGKAVSKGNDGLMKLTASGTLRAEVYYTDGGVDIITKEIVLQ